MIYSECCFNINNKNKACLLLTSICNLNCAYCFSKCSNRDISLSPDNFNDLILNLTENNIKYVVLSGGEPLLYKDIYKIIKKLSNEDFEISMCTNATLATDKVCKQLFDCGLKKVTISFDDVKKEQFDMITGQKGSYDKVVQGIQNFVNNSFDVTINVVINDSDCKKIDEIVNWATKMEVKEICFTLPVCKTGDIFSPNEKTVQKLYSYLNKISMDANIAIEFNNPKCNSDACPSKNSIWGVHTNGKAGECLVKHFLKR